MKQVLVRKGAAFVEQVPAPDASPNSILVRVAYSCISVGTEMTGVRLSGMPLYRRALRQPEHARRVLELMRDQGIKQTWDRVTQRLGAGVPTGYSAAGTVMAVGGDVEGFRLGDRVACAGAGVANHAEIIDVPVNLAVSIPAGVDLATASTVTLGAIAIQGVRRAQPTLGETMVVVGLGILGQLACQLLRANGCRVIAVDIDPERVATAVSAGAPIGIDASSEDYVSRTLLLTDGFGADGIIVTAASPESEIINQAFRACRKKGRVVLVGDVGLDLKRTDLYAKELDFLISTSYGPGRYDPVYEEGGHDYPLPYVRWTENRNMEAYLQLLDRQTVSIAGFSTERYRIEEADRAFAALKGDGRKPILMLLEYPESTTASQRKITLRESKPLAGRIAVAVAGAGTFAQGVHLPNLSQLRNVFETRCVMSRTGSNVRAAAARWGASYATTSYDEVLADSDISLVIIATRHDLHGRLALQALRAGKNVLVEKPLALTSEELDDLENFFTDRRDCPVLMTGFNRRFSPAMQQVMGLLKGRTTPLIINYRMNAGFIPEEHWVHGAEGGGRNIGEACHVYDLFLYLVGSAVRRLSASAMGSTGKQWHRNDNFVATLEFDDGSVCTLTYTALGSKSHPKERMDLYCDGMVASLDDFKTVTICGRRVRGWRSMTQDKGHLNELKALGACLTGGREWPISLDHQVQATRISFEVEKLITST